jgi:hypothetical protein
LVRVGTGQPSVFAIGKNFQEWVRGEAAGRLQGAPSAALSAEARHAAAVVVLRYAAQLERMGRLEPGAVAHLEALGVYGKAERYHPLNGIP